ncbi:MAG: type I restriction-modification system endonuclease [Thermoguttaceae bacterium]|nr:type I restriction-modification system endonuclease [Thermoguttaceae bacterium]
MPSNFDFLQDSFPHLANWGALAEKYVRSDPAACLYHLGRIAETFTLFIFKSQNVPYPEKNDHCNRINALFNRDYIDGDVKTYLHSLRRKRNDAAHSTDFVSNEEKTITADDARKCLELTHYVCQWLYQTYVDQAYQQQAFALSEENAPIQLPDPKELSDEEIEKLIAESDKRARELKKLSREERRKRIQSGASQRPRTEAETRVLIDAQLRQVGWEADTDVVRYSKGVRPQKGRNLAIAEWPTLDADGEEGRADYALFVGEKLVGIIEAKDSSIDVYSILDGQCKEYARSIRPEDEQRYAWGQWGEYSVPFVFATNGNPFNEQLKTKSGIWFQDLRDPKNLPRPLRGWISPKGALAKLKQDDALADDKLRNLSFDFLKEKNGLGLYYFQVDAIKAVEEAVFKGQKNMLVAMATGTGKTRTTLAMIYRFLKTNRFERILFLVDRRSLGNQAYNVFNESKLEDFQTLCQLYNVKPIDDPKFDSVARVRVATVQSMVKKVLYDDGETKPSVSDYDLIIVDEAHRGYILDKEMSEAELFARDQRDFQSAYRAVIEYFDCHKIGLTATPAPHTIEIFGEPVYRYAYTQGVLDGILADHDRPHVIETELSKNGIKLKPGDAAYLLNKKTGEIQDLDFIPDELDFKVDDFNRRVIVEAFNRAVLEEIAKDLRPDKPKIYGKTLIFAVDDDHADAIVMILREIYEKQGISPDYILKITGQLGDKDVVDQAIRRFKNEDAPSVAVTVDLLTTGIDVPEITTLVFMRAVKSRILFEQMLGRATRLCPKLKKDRFEIYDAVGAYEAIEDFNTMKPAVVDPKATFTQIVDGLLGVDDEGKIKAQVDQLVAKLQRVKVKLDDETLDRFKFLTDGQTPDEFVATVKNGSSEEAKELLLDSQKLLTMLDSLEFEGRGREVVVVDAEDKVISHTRPDVAKGDYLEEFANYIRENREKIEAINIVCTRPRDLTRKALKELRAALREENFTQEKLNRIKFGENAQIAADIVTWIRNAALGSPLLDHRERISRAVATLKEKHNFNSEQLAWLKSFENYLTRETVLSAEDFKEEPFKIHGGFDQFNKLFNNRLRDILDELNNYLYNELGSAA